MSSRLFSQHSSPWLTLWFIRPLYCPITAGGSTRDSLFRQTEERRTRSRWPTLLPGFWKIHHMATFSCTFQLATVHIISANQSFLLLYSFYIFSGLVTGLLTVPCIRSYLPTQMEKIQILISFIDRQAFKRGKSLTPRNGPRSLLPSCRELFAS